MTLACPKDKAQDLLALTFKKNPELLEHVGLNLNQFFEDFQKCAVESEEEPHVPGSLSKERKAVISPIIEKCKSLLQSFYVWP